MRAKTVAKSASGALEIQHFSPVSRQRPASGGPSGSAARASAPASEPASGSLSAEGGHRAARDDLRQPARPLLLRTGLDDGVCAQALERERGFGFGGFLGQGLPQQAQVEGAHRAFGGEQAAQQAQFAEGRDQRAVRAGPGSPSPPGGAARSAVSARSSAHHFCSCGPSANAVTGGSLVSGPGLPGGSLGCVRRRRPPWHVPAAPPERIALC
ncbi:hypothetical protein SRIMM317S_02967 [Streptomyces rimosus subsp. rimosus]